MLDLSWFSTSRPKENARHCEMLSAYYFRFSSSDKKTREFEKEKLQLDLKNTDERLGELVEGKLYLICKTY